MTKTLNPISKPLATKKSKEPKHLSRDDFELEEIAYDYPMRRNTIIESIHYL